MCVCRYEGEMNTSVGCVCWDTIFELGLPTCICLGYPIWVTCWPMKADDLI